MYIYVYIYSEIYLGKVPRGELLVREGQARVLVHLEAEVESVCGVVSGVRGVTCVFVFVSFLNCVLYRRRLFGRLRTIIYIYIYQMTLNASTQQQGRPT